MYNTQHTPAALAPSQLLTKLLTRKRLIVMNWSMLYPMLSVGKLPEDCLSSSVYGAVEKTRTSTLVTEQRPQR